MVSLVEKKTDSFYLLLNFKQAYYNLGSIPNTFYNQSRNDRPYLYHQYMRQNQVMIYV